MPEETTSNRPDKVNTALTLLYIVIGVGILQAALSAIRHVEVRSPEFLIVTKTAIYAFSIFLLLQIGRGKNWARWWLAVNFFIALPLVIMPTFEVFSDYPLNGLLELTQVVLYLTAMRLLFQPDVNPWFQRSPSGDQ